LERHTDETGSFSWPTPRVTGSGEDIEKIQQRFQNGLQYKKRLEEAVALWPTMTANGMGSTGHRALLDKRISSGDITPDEKRQMTAGHGGRLNPTWVEWLMGFPLGWTDLEDLETQ
jgi:DNA (cytosine-5)-methyltransferase 1